MDSITRKIFKNSPNWTEAYKLLMRKELYSNFIDRDIDTQFESVVSEVNELKEEIANKNSEEIVKELWDVIFVTLLAIQGLVKEGLITEEDISSIFTNQSNKIYSRSPQLLSWDKVSVKEEERLWKHFKTLHNNHES